MFIDIISWTAVALILATSTSIMISRDWRVSFGALAAQYLAAFWLVTRHLPLAMGSAKLITGWMVVAALGMTRLGISTSEDENKETDDEENILINQVQKNIVHKTNTRHDLLTYASAKTYIEQKHPRVLFLGLGETFTTSHTVNNAIPLKPVEIIREKTSFPNMASLNK